MEVFPSKGNVQKQITYHCSGACCMYHALCILVVSHPSFLKPYAFIKLSLVEVEIEDMCHVFMIQGVCRVGDLVVSSSEGSHQKQKTEKVGLLDQQVGGV